MDAEMCSEAQETSADGIHVPHGKMGKGNNPDVLHGVNGKTRTFVPCSVLTDKKEWIIPTHNCVGPQGVPKGYVLCSPIPVMLFK